MGFNDLCGQRELYFITARKRTKRIVIQIAQARPLNHRLRAIGRFCRYEYFPAFVLGLPVLRRACAQPLERVRKFEEVEIALNRLRVSGVYRQTIPGSIALAAAAVLSKLWVAPQCRGGHRH